MPNITNAARDIPQLFKPDLQKDEKIVWSGQPTPSIFSAGDIFVIPFSLMWGGFAYFWEFSVITMYLQKHNPGLLFMVAWGIPFVVIGSYMIFGRFIVQSWQQKNTFYAVTNQRVLILSTFRGRSTQAIFLAAVPTVSKTVNNKGVGSIYFGDTFFPVNSTLAPNAVMLRRGNTLVQSGFNNIKDVNKVYDLISKQKTLLEKEHDRGQ